MGNVMAYSGLTTKIRAMQAKLLTQADYETISGFTDVVQVVEFLKTKPAYASLHGSVGTGASSSR